jgi:hypothetical protein
MVIAYYNNCHLLLWSSCKSTRADAQAYVNKSFCQLSFSAHRCNHMHIYIERVASHWLSTFCMCTSLPLSSSISNQHNMLFYVLLLWHTDDDHISSFMMISIHPIALFLKKICHLSCIRSFSGVLAHSRCLFTLVLWRKEQMIDEEERKTTNWKTPPQFSAIFFLLFSLYPFTWVGHLPPPFFVSQTHTHACFVIHRIF